MLSLYNRISEALDEKTDVRTLGMEGFYAGLLTKNIAMGSEVEKNALSAFTAGSGGQKRIIPVSGDSVEPVMQEQGRDIERDERLEVSKKSMPSALQGANLIHDDSSQVIQSTLSASHAGISTTAGVDSNPPSNPDNRVSAARERYLARKRTAGQMDS